MATAFSIDKNIPIPSGRSKYPFRSMEVGDSFAFPSDSPKSGLYTIASREGIKIAVRDDGEIVRVWRVA